MGRRLILALFAPWYTHPSAARGRLAGVVLGAMLLFAAELAGAVEPPSIAVAYPDIGEPYRTMFAQIIEGIEDRAGARVDRYPLRSDTDSEALQSSLRRQNTRVVIALGRQGMKFAATLDRDIHVVGGAVLTAPESEARAQTVISLAPDPALLFAQLKAMAPAVQRVFVVYDPNINAWLMTLAKEAARAQNLVLVAHEVDSLRGAVKIYRKIFAAADSRRDALWLPQDAAAVEEGSVLSLVLRESWDRTLAVFSSSFGHVQRGVLFSVYPDNVALGKSLADLAQGILTNGDHGKRGMRALRDARTAVNLRTAKHLGLDLDRQRNSFGKVFPEP